MRAGGKARLEAGLGNLGGHGQMNPPKDGRRMEQLVECTALGGTSTMIQEIRGFIQYDKIIML